MGGPILPVLREHFGIQAARTGLITSAFPLGSFIAVSLFPRLSDVIGRKPVLIISYLGVGIGFALQSLAVALNLPFPAFLALRAGSGAFAGASTVVKAYLADITDAEALPRVMAYREAAGTLSFIIGPTLGGLLFSLTNLQSVVLVSGLTSVAAAVLVSAFLREPKVNAWRQHQGAPSVRSAAVEEGEPEVEGASLGRPVATMLGVSFAFSFGQAFFDAFFAVSCAEKFGWQPAFLGPLLTCSACLIFLNSTFVYSRLVTGIGIVPAAIGGLLSVSCGLALVGSSGGVWPTLAALALYALGVPIFTPSVPTILASCAPRGQRGSVLGMGSAVVAVARILSPIVLGEIYIAGPVAAFRCAGFAILLGAGLMTLQQGCLRRALRRAAKA